MFGSFPVTNFQIYLREVSTPASLQFLPGCWTTNESQTVSRLPPPPAVYTKLVIRIIRYQVREYLTIPYLANTFR